MSEICFLGYKTITNPFWNEFGHKSGVLFIIFKSCKPGKAHMNKNINPTKVRVHSPSKGQVKPMGGKGEKIFSNIV